MTHQSQYISWLSAGLGLKYLKLGLEDFVTQEVGTCHKGLIQSVAMLMGLSSSSNIVCSGQTLIKNVNKFRPSIFYCKNHATSDIKICISSQCPNATCHILITEITKLHRQKKPIWNNTNMNPNQWLCDPWEFAKCYLSVPGSQHKQSIQETDCSGILSIMINLLPLSKTLKILDKDINFENDALSKV